MCLHIFIITFSHFVRSAVFPRESVTEHPGFPPESHFDRARSAITASGGIPPKAELSLRALARSEPPGARRAAKRAICARLSARQRPPWGARWRGLSPRLATYPYIELPSGFTRTITGFSRKIPGFTRIEFELP